MIRIPALLAALAVVASSADLRLGIVGTDTLDEFFAWY